MAEHAAAEAGRGWRPRGVAELVDAVTRPVFRARSPATALLLADWAAIAGPALAARTTPHRLVSGTLTLGCDGPTALELAHLAVPLMARINGHAGRTLVTALRFVPARAPGAPPAPLRRTATPTATPIADLPPGPLNDALAGLRATLDP